MDGDVTPEEIRQEAGTEAPRILPFATSRAPIMPPPEPQAAPPPQEVHGQQKPPPFPDVQRNYDALKTLTAAVLLGANTEQRAYDYQQQQLQPLRDIERERALAEKDAQEAALEAWENRDKPTFGESVTANFMLENVLISSLFTQDIPEMPPLPGYDPLKDDMEGYWPIAGELVKAVHPAQAMAIKANYDNETYQRKIQAESSTAINLIAGVGAGMTDPVQLGLMLLPGGVAVRFGNAARFAYGVGATTTGAAISEVLLHGNQSMRTLDESAINVLSGALLEGSIGGTYLAMRYRQSPEYIKAKSAIGDFFRRGGMVRMTDEYGDSAGAARTVGEDVSLVRFDPKVNPVRWAIGALPLLMSRLTPAGKALHSGSNKVRTTAVELAEINMFTTNEQGHMAAETLTKVDYRRASAAKLDARAERMAAAKEDGMTPEQFDIEMDFAQRRLDEHENPHVAAAAQTVRKVTADLWKRAAEVRIPGTYKEIKDADGFVTGAEPLDTATALSYQTRVYDMQKIDADYHGFMSAVKAGVEDARVTHNADLDVRIKDFKRESKGDLAAAKLDIEETKMLVEAKNKLIENADTAIKGNAETIGRFKVMGGKDAEIADLQLRIKDIEANRKALKKELRSLKSKVKASKEKVSGIKAKIKEMEGERIAAYEAHELDAIANSYYQGVANLKEGDVHFNVNSRPDILKSRVPIKDVYLEPYLEKNWEKRLDHHVKTLAPRIRLAEKFGNLDGDYEMKSVLADINKSYADQVQDLKAAGKIKEAQRLDRERQAQIDNLEYMRDSLLNRTFDKNPADWKASAGRSLLNFNATTKLNGMMISSIPEVGKIVARHGIPKFNDALIRALKNWKIDDLPKAEAARIASALYRAQSSRTGQMIDVYDITPTTYLEKTTKKLSELTNYWSGQQGFDSLFKTVIGILADDVFVRLAQAGDKAALRKIGFKPEQIDVIMREVPLRARENGELWESGMDMWDLRNDKFMNYKPRELRDFYDAMIVKEADTLIVAPGIGDRPKFMSTLTMRVIFQFKSFIMASTNRTMVPMTQGSNVDLFRNLAYMNAFALGSHVLYQTAVGRDIDWSNKDALINEMMNRGGYMGYATELIQMARRAAGLPVAGKHQGRDNIGEFFGPSFGSATDLWRLVNFERKESGDLATDIDARIHALRKLTPFQNHFLIRRLLDKAEGGAARLLGGEGRFANPK